MEQREVADCVVETIKQLKLADSIGHRETPVVSYWPMRDKWKRKAITWTNLGTDGDMMIDRGAFKAIIPATLCLTYIKVSDGLVCQLAHIQEEESVYKIAEIDAARLKRYDDARKSALYS